VKMGQRGRLVEKKKEEPGVNFFRSSASFEAATVWARWEGQPRAVEGALRELAHASAGFLREFVPPSFATETSLGTGSGGADR